MKSSQKIAIVYDWVDKWGGVERVLLALHSLFPEAHLFTSYYDKNKAKWAKNLLIKSSFIDHLPIIRSNRKLSFFLFPFAFESFNFSNYDVVFSVSSSFAKSIITKPGTVHICYLLTPTRYLWIYPERYIPSYIRLFFLPLLNYMKIWDKIVSNRPDKLISLSKIVSKRITLVYGKKTDILYPPFDTFYWKKFKDQQTIPDLFNGVQLPNKFFLVVSRLEPYKRVDLVIKVFNLINKDLIIVGKGSQRNQLKACAGRNSAIHFMQDLTDTQLTYLYKKAQAIIMPQQEDFGYVALEAQFMGCPVISYKESGVREIIIENKTGLLFSEQSVASIREVLERFDQISYNLKHTTVKYGEYIAKKFDLSIFRNKLLHILKSNI